MNKVPNTSQPVASKDTSLWTRQVTKQITPPTAPGDLKWLFFKESVGGQEKWFATTVFVLGTPQPGQPMPPRLTTKLLLSEQDAQAIETVFANLFDFHCQQLHAEFLKQS